MSSKDDVVSEIIDNLRRVFQAVNEHSKRAERETGLTGPQLWAIKTIAENSPLRVTELARLMYLHPATVVGILDRLEIRGLATRTRSSDDRRVVTVELSPRGKDLVKKAPGVAQRLLVAGLESLPPRKLSGISRGIEHLAEILGVRDKPPQLILSPEVNKPKKGTRRRGKRR